MEKLLVRVSSVALSLSLFACADVVNENQDINLTSAPSDDVSFIDVALYMSDPLEEEVKRHFGEEAKTSCSSIDNGVEGFDITCRFNDVVQDSFVVGIMRNHLNYLREEKYTCKTSFSIKDGVPEASLTGCKLEERTLG